MRALVVDDAPTVRLLLRRYLQETGWEVAEAASAEEALETLAREPSFDLGLIDWHLPGLDGLELLRRIRGMPGGQGTLRLVMVSTEQALPRIAEALAAGADEFLMKPFDRAMLQHKLALLDTPL